MFKGLTRNYEIGAAARKWVPIGLMHDDVDISGSMSTPIYRHAGKRWRYVPFTSMLPISTTVPVSMA